MSFDEDSLHEIVLKLADKNASNHISLSIATLHFNQILGHFERPLVIALDMWKERELILIKKIIESWLIEIGVQLTI